MLVRWWEVVAYDEAGHVMYVEAGHDILALYDQAVSLAHQYDRVVMRRVKDDPKAT
jgi:hypothetical protein